VSMRLVYSGPSDNRGKQLVADDGPTSQPADVLPHLPDPKPIRDRVVDALRDAIIAVTRLGHNLRAVDRNGHAPRLAADRPANACQGGLDQ
jgi:hypothetical protein